jgi:hypothetical protein
MVFGDASVISSRHRDATQQVSLTCQMMAQHRSSAINTEASLRASRLSHVPSILNACLMCLVSCARNRVMWGRVMWGRLLWADIVPKCLLLAATYRSKPLTSFPPSLPPSLLRCLPPSLLRCLALSCGRVSSGRASSVSDGVYSGRAFSALVCACLF